MTERIAGLAETWRKVELQALSEAGGEKQNLTRQLEQMLAYKEDYRCMLLDAQRQGLTGYRLQELRSMIGRLDGAIMQLNAKLLDADATFQQAQETWREQDSRTKILQEVASTARTSELTALADIDDLDLSETISRPLIPA